MSVRRVVLHVGTPKTGTSFVQELLWQNRDRLAARGVLYPADRFDAHFLAALDLLELPWGGLEEQAVGAWDRLAEQVRGWEGTVIISHEILATASREHVRRALDSFGAETVVDVVVSGRDLVRQVPAEWQENVKHRRTASYGHFLAEIQEPEPSGRLASWFWAVQDIPSILDRWGADLPPERVHVITVPKPGAPRTLLWERFASVFGLDPDELDRSGVDKPNTSLGVAESALVLRINERVNGVLPNEQYRELVRELLAHRTLSRRTEAVRLRLPDDVRRWAVQVAEDWIDELASREYDVVGSLEELRPDPVEDETDYLDPDSDLSEQVGDAALHGLATVLVRAGEMRREIDDLRGQLDAARAERDQARREVGLVLRTKRALVNRADRNRWLGLGLRLYRWVRRRPVSAPAPRS